MSLLLLVALVTLPGTWISFGLKLDRASWKARLALGTVLSPLVVSVEVCLLKLMGLPFHQVVFVVIVTTIPSIVLVLRRPNYRCATKHWPVAVCGLVLFLLLSRKNRISPACDCVIHGSATFVAR